MSFSNDVSFYFQKVRERTTRTVAEIQAVTVALATCLVYSEVVEPLQDRLLNLPCLYFFTSANRPWRSSPDSYIRGLSSLSYNSVRVVFVLFTGFYQLDSCMQ